MQDRQAQDIARRFCCGFARSQSSLGVFLAATGADADGVRTALQAGSGGPGACMCRARFRADAR